MYSMCDAVEPVSFVHYINSKIVSVHKPATPKIYDLSSTTMSLAARDFLVKHMRGWNSLFLTVIIISSQPEKSNWEIRICIL